MSAEWRHTRLRWRDTHSSILFLLFLPFPFQKPPEKKKKKKKVWHIVWLMPPRHMQSLSSPTARSIRGSQVSIILSLRKTLRMGIGRRGSRLATRIRTATVATPFHHLPARTSWEKTQKTSSLGPCRIF